MSVCACTGECKRTGRCPNTQFYGSFSYAPQNLGWTCPKCNKVHAPFIPGCNCHITKTIYGPLTSEASTLKPQTTCKTDKDDTL